MAVRCKMKLIEIHQSYYNRDSRTLVFHTEYDHSIPEDQRFQIATPTGRLEQHVDNPAALAQFELGKSYYFDAVPVEAAEPNAPAM
ncbi:MAG: hypothetical protein AB7G12_12570 [Thermoanaerobaculia bacterium]